MDTLLISLYSCKMFLWEHLWETPIEAVYNVVHVNRFHWTLKTITVHVVHRVDLSNLFVLIKMLTLNIKI